MIISEIQSEIGHCSCVSAKFKAPADFSHHAILARWISLTVRYEPYIEVQLDEIQIDNITSFIEPQAGNILSWKIISPVINIGQLSVTDGSIHTWCTH